MSQGELAERAGVGHSTVGVAAKGRKVLVSSALRIADAMGIPFGRCFRVVPDTDTLSAKTIIEHHRVISAVLEYAFDEMLIPFNPAKRAKPPRLPKSNVKSLELEELRAVTNALSTEPLKCQVCIQLLIATGARRGEIMGLRWENVNWKNRSLFLCENRVHTKETGAISTTLKTGESRTVTVSEPVIQLLKRWRNEQVSTFMKLGVRPSGYVMTNNDGEPMHPDSPTEWLKKFSVRHNLPPLHPHIFRHTQASLLIAEGVDILTVSKRLGHAKVSTTTDIYAHALAKSDEKTSTVLDNLLYKRRA